MSSWAILVTVSLLAAQMIESAPPTPLPPASALAGDDGPASGFIRLPAAMPIDIEIAETVGSNISHIDDMFTIRIGAPVMNGIHVLIPSGMSGGGQVVHAAKSTGLGKAGELILAARFIACGPLRIPLRGMRFETSGKDKSGQVIALSAIAIPFAFLSGGKVLIPAGTHATAKLASAVDIPVGGCAAPAPIDGGPRLPAPSLAMPSAVATQNP